MNQLTNIMKLSVLFLAGVFLAACAGTGTMNSTAASPQKESLLQQAGFQTVTVTTAKQKQRVEALPVGKVSAVTYKGKLFYVYPTAQKDRIYYGKQVQYNTYKQSLRNQQGQQQMAGYATITEETAGPNHIQVTEFDGFGPMGDDSWNQ